ncbi:hypothetical protein HYV11_03080 [Candidatus Dependentiae bacterium]|nr:hypothetical protein [Candidatus Dependentiae bacterium]
MRYQFYYFFIFLFLGLTLKIDIYASDQAVVAAFQRLANVAKNLIKQDVQNELTKHKLSFEDQIYDQAFEELVRFFSPEEFKKKIGEVLKEKNKSAFYSDLCHLIITMHSIYGKWNAGALNESDGLSEVRLLEKNKKMEAFLHWYDIAKTKLQQEGREINLSDYVSDDFELEMVNKMKEEEFFGILKVKQFLGEIRSHKNRIFWDKTVEKIYRNQLADLLKNQVVRNHIEEVKKSVNSIVVLDQSQWIEDDDFKIYLLQKLKEAFPLISNESSLYQLLKDDMTLLINLCSSKSSLSFEKKKAQMLERREGQFCPYLNTYLALMIDYSWFYNHLQSRSIVATIHDFLHLCEFTEKLVDKKSRKNTFFTHILNEKLLEFCPSHLCTYIKRAKEHPAVLERWLKEKKEKEARPWFSAWQSEAKKTVDRKKILALSKLAEAKEEKETLFDQQKDELLFIEDEFNRIEMLANFYSKAMKIKGEEDGARQDLKIKTSCESALLKELEFRRNVTIPNRLAAVFGEAVVKKRKVYGDVYNVIISQHAENHGNHDEASCEFTEPREVFGQTNNDEEDFCKLTKTSDAFTQTKVSVGLHEELQWHYRHAPYSSNGYPYEFEMKQVIKPPFFVTRDID